MYENEIEMKAGTPLCSLPAQSKNMGNPGDLVFAGASGIVVLPGRDS